MQRTKSEKENSLSIKDQRFTPKRTKKQTSLRSKRFVMVKRVEITDFLFAEQINFRFQYIFK